MRQKAYFVASILVAAGTVVVSWGAFPVTDWTAVALLAVVALAADSAAFQLPLHGSVSLAFSATYAAMLYGGPSAAALTALLGSVSVLDIRNRKPVLDIAFNSAQLVIATVLAASVYLLLGGTPLVNQSSATVGPLTLVASFGAASAFFLVNISMVGAAIAISHRISMRAVLRGQGFAGYWVSLLVLALLGWLMAHLIASSSWFGLLLLVLPFAMARQTFRVYAELNEAYTETVRSLVTAIEAKDRYTRGHSERVAVHARRLAAALGLTPAEVDLAERAALLHDVGKIGLSQSTLTSAEQLSAVEVRQVRRHPVIGAELAEDVAFLSDVVPVIRHHHERVDGAGYPDGLVGPAIPLLARILAVVDSYDAMTSDRAYRPGMSDEAARAELKRVAGRQLDERLVAAFNALSDEPLPGEAVS